jgi:hypothetical protein
MMSVYSVEEMRVPSLMVWASWLYRCSHSTVLILPSSIIPKLFLFSANQATAVDACLSSCPFIECRKEREYVCGSFLFSKMPFNISHVHIWNDYTQKYPQRSICALRVSGVSHEIKHTQEVNMAST